MRPPQRSLYRALLHRPVGISMALLALLLGGLCALLRMPLELTPQVEGPELTVHADWPGATAEAMERYLTAPVVETARTVAGIRKIRSVSHTGWCTVGLQCEPGPSMKYTRLELTEKLAALAGTFPPGAGTPEVERSVPEELRRLQGFVSYALSGPLPAPELRRIAEQQLAPALLALPGVAGVQVLGGEMRQVSVRVDERRLASFGLSFDALVRSFDAGGDLSRSSVVRQEGAVVPVKVEVRAGGARGLTGQVIGRTARGSAVLLGEAAEVSERSLRAPVRARLNGEPSVTIDLSRDPGSDLVRLADRVHERCAQLAATLPRGVHLSLQSDHSVAMRTAVNDLCRELAWSLLCVLVLLSAFLGNLRSPLVLLLSVLLSLAGTLLVFWMTGLTLHLLTLAGVLLGVGRLVDDATVVLDAIERRDRAGSHESSIAQAVGRIALPVWGSTLSTIGALVPVAFVPAELRPYLLEFACAVAVSLALSLLVAFTLLPAAALRGNAVPEATAVVRRAMGWLKKAYLRTLAMVLVRKKTFCLLALWALGLPCWLLPERIDGSSLPAALYNMCASSAWSQALRPLVDRVAGGSLYAFFHSVSIGDAWEEDDQTCLVTLITYPPGTADRWYDSTAALIERAMLRDFPSVTVTTRVGAGFGWVRVDMPGEGRRSALPARVKSAVVTLVAGIGGGALTVAGYGPGFSTEAEAVPLFAIDVRGCDYREVRRVTGLLCAQLRQDPRVVDIDAQRAAGGAPGAREVVAHLMPDALAARGATPRQVAETLAPRAGGGVWLSTQSRGGTMVPVVVAPAGAEALARDALDGILLSSHGGGQMPLRGLFRLVQGKVPSEIVREDQQYVQWITFRCRASIAGGTAMVDGLLSRFPVPPGCSARRLTGPGDLTREQGSSLLAAALAALVIVFMVTAALYESFAAAAAVVLIVPGSAIGLLSAFTVTGIPFGRGGFAAAILLVGIVTGHAIVLVDALMRARRRGRAGRGPALRAAAGRLRPVLMTSLAAAVGLVPMALGGRAGFWEAFAVGTVGGLASSTLLTLVLLPALVEILTGTTHAVRSS